MISFKILEYVVGVLIPLVVFSVIDRPRRSSWSVEGEPSGGSPRTPLEDLGHHAPPGGVEKPEAVPTCVSCEASHNFDVLKAGNNFIKHKG